MRAYMLPLSGFQPSFGFKAPHPCPCCSFPWSNCLTNDFPSISSNNVDIGVGRGALHSKNQNFGLSSNNLCPRLYYCFLKSCKLDIVRKGLGSGTWFWQELKNFVYLQGFAPWEFYKSFFKFFLPLLQHSKFQVFADSKITFDVS